MRRASRDGRARERCYDIWALYPYGCRYLCVMVAEPFPCTARRHGRQRHPAEAPRGQAEFNALLLLLLLLCQATSRSILIYYAPANGMRTRVPCFTHSLGTQARLIRFFCCCWCSRSVAQTCTFSHRVERCCRASLGRAKARPPRRGSCRTILALRTTSNAGPSKIRCGTSWYAWRCVA